MVSAYITVRRLHQLFAVCGIAIVGGSPLALAVHAKNSSVFLLNEAVEDAVNSQSHNFEFDLSAFDVLAMPETAEFLLSPDLYGRVADDSVATESTLTATHLQRGPPLC
jgi:hypothetical protein